MRMEQTLSIRAQRELWSALARRDGAVPQALLSTLVDAYLRVAAVRATALGDPCDAVSLALVRSIADARQQDGRENPAPASVLEQKLQTFVIHPLVMPWAKRSIVDAAKAKEVVRLNGIAPSPVTATPVTTPVNKRPRLQIQPETHELAASQDSGPALTADVSPCDWHSHAALSLTCLHLVDPRASSGDRQAIGSACCVRGSEQSLRGRERGHLLCADLAGDHGRSGCDADVQ